MGQVGEVSGWTGARWLLRVLYAILIVSAIAFLTLLLGDLVAALEHGGEGELHHLFVFELAWPVFLIGSLATLVAGVASLIVGWLHRSAGLKRYAWWAIGYVVIALALVVVAGGGFEL